MSDAERSRGWGPGWLVAAAFVGPGTVTTATVAGARFGAELLWALAFGVLATMALQEMAARLGLVTGLGLGEAIRARFERPAARVAAVGLVVAAIGLGNAAYQTGNLLGAGLGLEAAAGGPARGWAAVVSALAFGLLWSGSYRLLERALVALVAVMGAAFLVTAAAVRPDLGAIAAGLAPSMPSGGALLAAGLVGTTVVPYNLFLHASSVRERWDGVEDLPAARRDLVVSIAAGGAVSAAILLTAAGTIAGAPGSIESAADMARALEPTLGRGAGALFAVGLFAAGTTSAITAPLAAGWAVAGALGWRRDLDAPGVRAIWIGVLATGAAFATSGVRPVAAILFAQASNGILLPAVAAFLVVAANDRRRMGDRVNGWWSNAAAGVVLAVAALLGARALLAVAGAL